MRALEVIMFCDGRRCTRCHCARQMRRWRQT